MAISILGIGASGLNAAQVGIATTGHNIANAATPGYSRQETIQAPKLPQSTGAGFIGQGVQVDTIKRVYNQFLTNQVQEAQSQSSQLDTYYGQIQQIDNALSGASGGLAPSLQQFFSGVQSVAANPADTAARQTMLSKGQTLVSNFQAIDSNLAQLRDGVNSQIKSSVSQINTYAQQVAQLNNQIVSVENANNNQPANDLRDQRDQLINEINQQIRTTVVQQDDGSYNLFVGSGQSLVVGAQAFQLTTTPSPTNISHLDVSYVSGGKTITINQDSLTGGQLGGLLAFRKEALEPTQNALGQIAIGLAGTFNAQHKLGQDLNGNLGTDFFTVASPSVASSSSNTGNAVINASITNYSALTTSDYSIQYDGTNYTLTRLSDNTTQTFAAFPQTVDGLTLTLASGTANAGDQFLIRPTINGARNLSLNITDTSLIAAAAPIATSTPLTNTGTATISAGTVNTPPPPSANLKQPVTITFTSATTFNVNGTGTGNPAGVAYTSGSNISYNSWTMQISGTPAAGDTFTIGPNTSGIADNRNALLLAGLQTQKTLNGNTATYQDAYGQLVGQIANKTQQTNVMGTAQTAIVSQATQAQQSESGVNVDEEAANLIRYQQAYQASAQMMNIAGKLFDMLLNLGT